MGKRQCTVEGVEMKGRCILCKADSLQTLLAIDKVPISAQTLFMDHKESLECDSASLNIVMCQKCSLIYNKAAFDFLPAVSPYDSKDYYYSVSFTQQSKEYQREIVKRISSFIDLSQKNVLEIGCGDSFFLKEISAFSAKAIGFEPSKTAAMAQQYKSIYVINDFFKPSTAEINITIHLYVLRHVLEHINRPSEFIKALNGLFQGESEIQNLFIEVPNTIHLLQNRMFFDLYYDHIFYFSDVSLSYLLRKAGWSDIVDIGDKDGEFLAVLSKSGIPQDFIDDVESEKVIEYLNDMKSFLSQFDRWKQKLLNVLKEIKDGGKRIAAWGAGSRGVSFITALSREDFSFEYIVDTDPNKNMRYVPLTGTQVFTPDIIKRKPVDYILITSYTYFDEICSLLKDDRKNGLKVIRLYPEIKII